MTSSGSQITIHLTLSPMQTPFVQILQLYLILIHNVNLLYGLTVLITQTHAYIMFETHESQA